jgi:hypothetical protein
MSKKITLENVDSSELPEVPVIGEVKQIRFTQDMELVSTLADSDLFMIQAGADLEARPNTITFDLIIKNLSGPIEEGSKKFVTGDMMFKVIGDMNLLDTWDNTNLVSSLNATYVNVRRIEEELRREINRSTGKDEQHDEQIANLRQDLTSTNEMLNQEINRSVAKDNEHDELLEGLRDDVDSTSSKLDAEIDRSTTKDAEHDTLLKGLRVDVNANKSAIDSEVARSTARDEAHDAAISKNASDITTESSRAKAEEAKIRQEMQAADTNLQNAITAETERATGVEEDLQRQITDLSGSTDDRLEALEALSHEQNTDTGTTSKTFVIDSGNTGAMLKAEGGGLSTRTKGDAGYANFTVQNLVIKGDVTQEGDTFITQAERVEVRDNMILINEGETGAGVTAGFAGIEVDRGTEQNFMFGFNESDGMFKIGKEGNMFDVALRQPVGDMTDGMFASWDAATKTFKTTNLIPPTLKLYLGTNNVDISYNESDSGSIRLRTNGQSLNIFTKNGYTNFRSTLNKFQFIGDVSIYTGKLYTSADTFNIRVAGGSRMVIDGTGSTLSTPLTATSFFRSSDNAEVLYAVNPSTLTDGMFLSWDATNKMVVTTNIVPKGQSVFFGNENSFITYGSTSLNSGSGSAIGFNLNMQFGNLLIYPSSVSGCLVFDGGLMGQGYGNGIKFNSPINVEKVNSTGKFLELSVGDTTSIKMEGSGVTIATQVVSPSYHRSSDDSEVLYQADLKSVLTGKETNYAPSVKAVSDAIDAVNTGTTESLKNYLKLSGGTMTGPIIMNNSIVLKSKDNNGVERILIGKSIEGTTHIGDIDGKAQIYTSDTDVIHFRSTGSYKILDSYNLPDPATKSGNNAFTGTNSFVANKFSVGNFKVNTNSNLEVNIPYKEDATKLWRSLYFMYNSLEDTKVTFGSMISATAADYAYIGIGSVSYNNAQYKFRTESLDLNTIFRIDCGEATAISANESTIIFGSNKRGCYVRSNDTDLTHIKNNNSYKIWDASNLPTPASTSDIPDVSDMAKKREANTFTAQNTFTAGRFNVGPFQVTSSGSLLIDMANTGPWERKVVWRNNSAATSNVMFGSYGNVDNANYAWIGVGDVEHSTAQYIFYPEKMRVPIAWSLEDASENALVWSQSANLVNLGRGIGTTKIRSGAVDLIHTKGSTDYKILDESNYSQYLPTTSKWTYGFVHESKEVYDLNTDLVGPDKGKLAYNYTGPSYWTNGPTGMDYGTVIQIWGSGSPASTPSLMPQLAFDVNHNVANSTRYMYFRTANNLGYGDSSNWKRVVTADEKPAGYVLDENSYPALRYIESSTTLTWLRSPQSGFLPFTAINIVNGGYGNIGTSTWTFQSAYIANVYANKFITSGGSSSQFLKGDGSLDSTAYYPNVGRGFLSFDADGRPVMAYNQGYAAKFSDGITREILWTNGTNAVTLGNTTNNAIIQIAGTSMVNRASGETYATQEWTTGKLAKYLPLTGGTITGQLIVNYGESTPLIINNTNTSSSVTYISIRLKGANKTYIGCSDSYGPFLQDANTNRCIMVKSDGAYFGTELSAGSKLLTSSDLSGYATQTWANSQFAPLSIFKTLVGYPAIVNTTNEYILTSSGNITNVNYRTPSGTVIPTSWYWRNGTSTGYAAGYWGNLYMAEKLVATQEWVSGRGYLTSITKSMVTSALGYTPPTTNTTYSQATSSTLGLVKIGATGLAAKNYAVQLNSSGQMYVSVPWTDTDTTYSAATSSTYGLVKIGATGLSEKQYAVKLNSSGQMYVSVPWTDTDTNTHYTTRLYAGASGSATNVAISNPYLKVTDDNTYRNQVRFIGSGATSISSDDSGNITITSTNTTYGLASSSSNGLMSSSQYTKLSNCIETVSAANMVTSVQVVDTIPGESSQVTGRLYLKFA